MITHSTTAALTNVFEVAYLLSFDDILDIIAVLCHRPLLLLRQSLIPSTERKQYHNIHNFNNHFQHA